MEKFLAINWHPSIEDVIDNAFIRDERLETESITHRSLIGKWISPFEDIQEDYKEVDLNKVKIIKKTQPDIDGASKGPTKGAAKGAVKGAANI